MKRSCCCLQLLLAAALFAGATACSGFGDSGGGSHPTADVASPNNNNVGSPAGDIDNGGAADVGGEIAPPANFDFAFWDFLGRNANTGYLENNGHYHSQTYHEDMKNAGLRDRSVVWGASGVGLPADAAFGDSFGLGGTDLGIPALVQIQGSRELVFFFGNYLPNGYMYHPRSNPSWTQGDSFGRMGAADGAVNDFSYDTFEFQAWTDDHGAGADKGAPFLSIAEAAERHGVLFCGADDGRESRTNPRSEMPMWVPTGSYYDELNQQIWLWYGQYIDHSNGPQFSMRSSLIRVTPNLDEFGNWTDFRTMHVVGNDGCRHPFAKAADFSSSAFFMQVAPVAISNADQRNLGLPAADDDLSGALLFGTSWNGGSARNFRNYRTSPVYLGYFIPPANGGADDDDDAAPGADEYGFYVLAGPAGTAWSRVDWRDGGEMSADPYEVVNRGGDADPVREFGEISAQTVAVVANGETIARLVMIAVNATPSISAGSAHELRIACIDSLAHLKYGLNNRIIKGASWGYGDYLVPGSLRLVREGPRGSQRWRLYYDRVVSSWRGVGIERYGTAVVKSVANIPNDWLTSCSQ